MTEKSLLDNCSVINNYPSQEVLNYEKPIPQWEALTTYFQGYDITTQSRNMYSTSALITGGSEDGQILESLARSNIQLLGQRFRIIADELRYRICDQNSFLFCIRPQDSLPVGAIIIYLQQKNRFQSKLREIIEEEHREEISGF